MEVDDNADETVYEDDDIRVDDACDGDDGYGLFDDDNQEVVFFNVQHK